MIPGLNRFKPNVCYSRQGTEDGGMDSIYQNMKACERVHVQIGERIERYTPSQFHFSDRLNYNCLPHRNVECLI